MTIANKMGPVFLLPGDSREGFWIRNLGWNVIQKSKGTERINLEISLKGRKEATA